MKKKFVLFVFIIICSVVKSQFPTLSWAKQFGGGNNEGGYSVTTDMSGNVFTTGFFQGTSDFDPNAGVFNLSSAGSNDIFISKLDASGNFVWAKQMGGTGSDYGYSITTDVSGNVYITGYFQNTVDFDPGPGVFNLTSTGADIFILKLNSSGNFIWAVQMTGTFSGAGLSIAVNSSGEIYTTGYFNGTVDFDPGVGTFNLFSGSEDVFISKLSASGNFMWALQLGLNLSDRGNSITLDPSGDICLTGYFHNTVDFDPGAGTYNLTALGNSDIYILKLNSSGYFVWAKQMGGTMDEYANSITIDSGGNIYTTGRFQGTVDFDPGAGTFNITTVGNNDVFVSKLNSAGNFVWTKQIGSSGSDEGFAITVDGAGDVYTIGGFSGTADFDPGAGTFTLTSVSVDVFVNKLNSSGNFAWTYSMGGSSIDRGYGITVDGAGSIYTTGYFRNTADFDPGGGTLNISSVSGSDDTFIQKLGQCIIPAQPGTISGVVSLCSGVGANIYTIAPVFIATSYTWSLPVGWSGSSATNTISATPGSTGIFTVTAGNVCGTSPQQTLNVTVNPLPTITVNSGSICSGQSFTMTPNGASTYTFQGGSSVVSPTSTTSYTVVGTSTAGCVSPLFATSNVTVNALPIITINSGSICLGNSYTIVASGASTYTFSSGPIVSPTTTSSYSVTGTSTAGCVSSSAAIVNVTVNPLPTINVSTSNTMLCIGQSATLTASGALSYTFNPGGAGASIVVSPSITSTYTINGTDLNGCVNSSSFTQSVSACTGINQIANSVSEIQVYPNPFNNKIIVVSNFAKQPVVIFNVLGSLIYKTEMENEKIEIDFSKESSGIYFIKIGPETKKIVKE